MNIKPIAILAACAFFTGGCGKSPTPTTADNHDSQPPPPIVAEPFHGQVYKSLNGRTVLTLISRDECEWAEGGTTLLCKYTKPNDTLRIVTTALGTSQVIYFRFTDQGLQDNNGNVLLTPEKYGAAVAQIQQEKKRFEQEREAQQAKQLAEENQKRAVMEQRRNNFYAWLRSYCEVGMKFNFDWNKWWTKDVKPMTLTITTGPSFDKDGICWFYGKVHWNRAIPESSGRVEFVQDQKVMLKGFVEMSTDETPSFVELELFWWKPDSKEFENPVTGLKSKLTETKQANEFLSNRIQF